MGPKVSIIIPVYNTSDYLSQCLESLVGQTYRNLEIILIDDASKDSSPEICDQYAAKDSRVIVVHKQNEGASFARKAGIDLASGEYVMFVDSDDWIENDTVSQLVDSAEMNKADCVLFSYMKEFEDHSEKVYLFDRSFYMNHEDSEKYVHQRLIGPDDVGLKNPSQFNILSPMWGKLYKTHVVKRGLIVSEREIGGTGEDTLFNIYALDGCKSIVYLHECLYHYRKFNHKSLTTSYKPDLAQSLSGFYDYIEAYIAGSGKTEYSTLLYNRIACSIISLVLNEAHSDSSFTTKAGRMRAILNQPSYIRALGMLNIKNCKISWKVFFGLCKHRQSLLITGFIVMLRWWRNRH